MKVITFIGKFLNAIFAIIFAVGKTFTVDLYRNSRDYAKMAISK